MVSEKSMLGNPLLSDSDRSEFQAYFFQDHAKSPKRLFPKADGRAKKNAPPSETNVMDKHIHHFDKTPLPPLDS